jgi:hypothetical protein
MNTTDPMDYCEYAAVEILGGALRGYGEYSANAYKWPNDSGERGVGWEFVASWRPDTNRNQLWLVLEKLDQDLITDAANALYPTLPGNYLWLARLGSLGAFFHVCMEHPALALKALCDSHKSMTLAPEEAK